MATNEISRQYERVEFANLVGIIDLALWNTHIANFTPSVPISHSALLPNNGLEVFWTDYPSEQDEADLDALVASFVVVDLSGGETIVRANAGPVLASNGTPVSVIDYTTPPLEAGKYNVSWTSTHRLTAAVANTGSRATVTISGTSQSTHWDRQLVTAFNGNAIFKRAAGQTINIQYTIAKVGAGAADAEATDVRFTIDKLD